MPGLANRAPTAQEHSPKRIAQSEEVLLPVGKCAGGGALGSKDWCATRKTSVDAGSVFLEDKLQGLIFYMFLGLLPSSDFPDQLFTGQDALQQASYEPCAWDLGLGIHGWGRGAVPPLFCQQS